jgi:hypothetical protein
LKLAFGVSSYGNEYLNENKIQTGLGYSLPSLTIGCVLNFMQTRIESFGVNHKLIFDLGASSEIIPKFIFSINIQNLSQARFNDQDYIESKIKIGGQFEISNKINLYSEIEKQLRSGNILKVGLEYEAIKQCFIRMGFNGNPINLNLGMGYYWRKWSYNYAFLIHPVLGPGHSFGLGHEF